MADKGEYGEPWTTLTVRGELKSPEWACASLVAMIGIADPEQFMADVRLVFDVLDQGTLDAQSYSAAWDRLAAQLKGGE
ncbi:MAG: hypothetical protein KDI01_00585 [Halioglobus sp.]|nr:hypothetical protein [Halioglobus sp.]